MVENVRRILLAVPLVCCCTTAWAQTVVAPSDEVRQSATVGSFRISAPVEEMLLRSALDQSANPPARRDSLWNGTIIGIGVGAMTGSLLGLSVTDSERYGFNVPLTLGVIGAGIGAGLGAGIDAARASLQREPRMRLSPVITNKARGLMAWIRF